MQTISSPAQQRYVPLDRARYVCDDQVILEQRFFEFFSLSLN